MIHCFLNKLQNDWNVAKRGWDAQVLGEAPYKFTNALEAITKLRAEPKANNQYLPPFDRTSGEYFVYNGIQTFACRLSYLNFVRGLLFDDIQPLIGRFEILGTLCCTICEVSRRAENQKEAGLRDP